MSWLLDNPLAAMDSGYLLLLDAMAVGAVILACYRSVRSADRTGRMEPPEIPARPDPYEIAYLRGGEEEVTRIAIMSLLDRGLLRIAESRDWSSTALAIRREIDRGRNPDPGELSPIEACILKWEGFPATGRQIYQPDGTGSAAVSTTFRPRATGRYGDQPGGLPALIGPICDRYQDRLTAHMLLAPPEMRTLGSWLWWIGSALILGLGGYLIALALAKGEPIAAVLLCSCPLALFGVIALAPACLHFPRVSRRGRAYLEQLESAYERLKGESHRRGRSRSAFSKADASEVREPSVHADRLLMNGIFGEVIPAATPLHDLWNVLVLSGMITAPEESPEL